MKKLLLLAFLLRIIVAPFVEHGDVVQYYWWAQDLWNKGFLFFYDREIINAMRPTYPPVTSYIFFITGGLQSLAWQVAWFFNSLFSIFPSNLIVWLESQRGWFFINKLPAILADLAIMYFLYLFGREFNRKRAMLPAFLFAFLPPFFYTSAVWGQTDSIYAFFLIAAFYAVHKKKLTSGALLYTLSFLTKPTALFTFPVFIIWYLESSSLKSAFKSLILSIGLLLILYFPFHPENLINWVIEFYAYSLRGELDYIVANSFNFWGLVMGFGNVPEKILFLGVPARILGYLISTILILTLLIYSLHKKAFKKTGTVLLLSSIISFSAFLFLPRMHERYFYPTLIMLLPLVVTSKTIRNIVIALSLIHWINLYHFWWVPRIDFLVLFLKNPLVEKSLIIINIGLFVWLLNIYIRLTKGAIVNNKKEVNRNGK